MKYFIISGEASGDLHGANLVKQLKQFDTHAEFQYWGGDLMAETIGHKPLKHIKELAFMGFSEVIKNLRTIFKNIKLCKTNIVDYQPDVVIMIDYPGFNLRIAEFVKKQNMKVFYYISPTVWAWKENRVKKIKAFVDEMFVILPFEKPFYKKHNYEVNYFGHPLLDEIEQYNKGEKPTLEVFKQNYHLDDRPIIALLPGSRVQEIKVKLPIMLTMVDKYPDYQFVVSVAPTLGLDFVKEVANGKDVKFVVNKTYDLLSHSYAGLITSGTATLEAALFKVPQVVCYKGNAASFQIAKRIVDIKYISLANLILDREVITELIQNDLTSANLIKELDKILNSEHRKNLAKSYQELEEVLGGSGASKRIAQVMVEKLKN